MEKYTSLLCNIYDKKLVNLRFKAFESLRKFKKEITDRFGTERVTRNEADMAIIQDISSDVYEFLQLHPLVVSHQSTEQSLPLIR